MIWTRIIVLGAVGCLPAQAIAQQFTTADEVKPILEMTKGNWVALRKYNGNDLVYFTHLMSFRCGLDKISYGINGATETELPLEKCNTEYQQPNVMLDQSILPYITLPLGSVKSIAVTVTYDDGVTQSETIDASKVLIP